LGDLINRHPQLQEQLAGTMVQLLPGQQAALPPGRSSAAAAAAAPPVPLLQVVVQLALHGVDVLERAAAVHVLQSFCLDNSMGQLALLSSLSPSCELQPGLAASLAQILYEVSQSTMLCCCCCCCNKQQEILCNTVMRKHIHCLHVLLCCCAAWQVLLAKVPRHVLLQPHLHSMAVVGCFDCQTNWPWLAD
jgi:hypothetical protein